MDTKPYILLISHGIRIINWINHDQSGIPWKFARVLYDDKLRLFIGRARINWAPRSKLNRIHRSRFIFVIHNGCRHWICYELCLITDQLLSHKKLHIKNNCGNEIVICSISVYNIGISLKSLFHFEKGHNLALIQEDRKSNSWQIQAPVSKKLFNVYS